MSRTCKSQSKAVTYPSTQNWVALHATKTALNAHKMLRERYMITPREYAPTDCKLHLSFTSYTPSTELCLLEMSKKREAVRKLPPPPTHTPQYFPSTLRNHIPFGKFTVFLWYE